MADSNDIDLFKCYGCGKKLTSPVVGSPRYRTCGKACAGAASSKYFTLKRVQKRLGILKTCPQCNIKKPLAAFISGKPPKEYEVERCDSCRGMLVSQGKRLCGRIKGKRKPKTEPMQEAEQTPTQEAEQAPTYRIHGNLPRYGAVLDPQICPFR